jgi:imidazolonepropionase-like amidohydrolase
VSAARLALLALACFPALSGADTTAIVGGRVHTVADAGVIEQGTVLIRSGRIVAVGRDVTVPPDATIVDARGAWVTAGIFNAYTHLGLVEVEGVPSTIDNEAPNVPDGAVFDVHRGVNPDSTLLAIARSRGVTRAATFPMTTRSMVSGKGALIQLGGDGQPVFKPQALLYVELGAAGAALGGGARGAAFDRLSAMLADTGPASLNGVRSGELPIVVHVERASDILNALALRQQHPRLRVVLLGANEGWKVAEQIASARVPVILDSFANLPLDFETMGATQENAARLVRAGVMIAIAPLYRFHAAMPHNAGLVTQYAGNAVAHGLPWEQALEAITINPARIFGVAAHLGSLEPGKVADVVVWSGDPLDLAARPVALFVAGARTSLESRQTLLRDRYKDLSRPREIAYRY